MSAIRVLTRGAYDVQKLRIMSGNRIAGNFRAKLGQAPGTKAVDELDAESIALLDDLKQRYHRITDGMVASKHKDFTGDEIISSFTEFALVGEYIDIEKIESDHFKKLGKALEEVPIYVEFLCKVRGIGPAMAGVIVSEFDITKAKYPSSLWAYAGLDVAGDGTGRSKRSEHLVRREYVTKDGEVKMRDGITYNPWLKTKLMGVLAASFLRSKSPYAEHYHNYRHRLETDPARTIVDKPGRHTDDTWTKMRRHQAAQRYMVKMFLIDLYKAWRALEGLSVAPPYHEAKLGHKHRERVAA